MDIAAICARHFDAHKFDCSGFARAVAKDVGVTLAGQANQIVDTLAAGGDGWDVLPDGPTAAAAAQSRLVIAGLRGDRQAKPVANGHVVVVVPGALAHGKYPTAWWGSLAKDPRKNETINWAWTQADRDKVIYAAHNVTV